VDREHDDAALQVLQVIGLLGPLRREMARCAAPELHAGAAAAVWQLAAHGPLRMRDLATSLQLDLSVVSRQVAELVADGHLQRAPDPEDRRACLLSVTAAGQVALDAVVARLTDRFRCSLAGWEAADLLRVARDLRRLSEDLLPIPATAANGPADTVRGSVPA